MRIFLLLSFLFFALPQVRAQLRVAAVETEYLALEPSFSAPSVAGPLVRLPSLQQALLAPQSYLANQESSIANPSFPLPHLAFFCRIEVELEKAVKMPVRFRLGSVDYVDYLEGKRSY
ncbi:MAG: hypothetical protein AAF433_14855 [Bacteroidota bacterium]